MQAGVRPRGRPVPVSRSGLRENGPDVFFEPGKIPLDHGPHFVQIDSEEIVVNEDVAHPDERPGDLIVPCTDFVRQGAGRLTDDLNVVNDPDLNHLIGFKGFPASGRGFLDFCNSPRECLPGVERRVSQRNGFPENGVAEIRSETALGRDIYPSSQKPFEG